MQVRYPGRTGALVQVVDVLGNDFHVEMLFQGGNGAMRRIGLFLQHVPPPGVVKVNDPVAVIPQSFRGAHVLDAVILPQPVRIAEGGDAAVGAYSGAGKDHEFFHKAIRFTQRQAA